MDIWVCAFVADCGEERSEKANESDGGRVGKSLGE